jgi:hypothetical protein
MNQRPKPLPAIFTQSFNERSPERGIIELVEQRFPIFVHHAILSFG